MRTFVPAVIAAALLAVPGAAFAVTPPEGSAPPPAPPPPTTIVITAIPSPGGSAVSKQPPASQQPSYPSGCRDIDISTQQTSFLFHSVIYRFHQLKHWCWRSGGIYAERHAWSFDGSATACLGTIYPDNSWFFTWWHGIATSGHYSEERAHVTNCIFHLGDWKEFYPDVKVWAYADGSYKVATDN